MKNTLTFNKQLFTYEATNEEAFKLPRILAWSAQHFKLHAKEKSKKVIFPKRGEVWTCDFGENIGSEVNKIRPCVIIQNNKGNEYSSTTIVLPISHRECRLPTQVKVWKDSFIFLEDTIDGAILGEQIKTISKARLGRKIGNLSENELFKIEQALKVALGMG